MREVLVLRYPGETRVAAVEDHRIVDLGLFRDDELRRGAILKGRVTGKTADGRGLFLDLGHGRSGFLQVHGEDAPSEGTALLVQVSREAHSGKAAEVTTAPALQGRFLVYTPTRPGMAVSKSIADKAERRLLFALIEGQEMPGEGIVVRTAAVGASAEALTGELTRLRQTWKKAQSSADPGSDPAQEFLIGTEAAIRFNDRAEFAKAKTLYPDLAERMSLEDGVITEADVDALLDSLATAEVPLLGGGRLLVESTAALTAIDIDSGPATPVNANRAAVEEIARQVRLRNLAGQILVDPIPSGGKGGARVFLEALRHVFADDPTPTTVHGLTHLGLVEITRERRAAPLAELRLQPCRAALNPASVALDALRAALTQARATKSAALTLTAAPPVCDALRGPLAAALKDTETALGGKLALKKDQALTVEVYRLDPVKP